MHTVRPRCHVLFSAAKACQAWAGSSFMGEPMHAAMEDVMPRQQRNRVNWQRPVTTVVHYSDRDSFQRKDGMACSSLPPQFQAGKGHSFRHR